MLKDLSILTKDKSAKLGYVVCNIISEKGYAA